MAAPSHLPSAAHVADACFQKYITIDPDLDPALQWNLEALAQHFADLDTLKTVFIRTLVPWQRFVRPPNAGHAAVADLLLTGAAQAALSSNYDTLIERSAWDYGADFRGSLDGDEAQIRAAVHAPLLKFHGCQQIDPDETVWTATQLTEPVLAGRIAKSRTWMASQLRERDFLVVGFWSDWGYLNAILGDALKAVTPLSVTLVDPSPAATLQVKAPDLWAVAHADHVQFEHVQSDGANFLDELRQSFSLAFLRKIVAAGQQAYQTMTGTACAPAHLQWPTFGSEALYNLRRDAEGTPHSQPAREKSPPATETLGLFHILLRAAGAAIRETGYTLNGRTIRVVNGANQVLSLMATRFEEAPSLQQPEITAAIGAQDLGLPGDIIRAGLPGDILRTAPASRWLDFDEARKALGL